jgi:hypothetical protein
LVTILGLRDVCGERRVDRGEPMILFNFPVKMRFLPPTFGLSCN